MLLSKTNAFGQPHPTFANAMLALRLDPNLHNLFAFDDMLQAVIIMRSVRSGQDSDRYPGLAIDTDVVALQEMLRTRAC